MNFNNISLIKIGNGAEITLVKLGNGPIVYQTDGGIVWPQRTTYEQGQYKNSSVVLVNTLVTSEHTDLSNMFNMCQSLEGVNTEGWDTSNVTDMSNMFNGCDSLTELDLSGWDVKNVTNMFQMFARCSSLTTLNLSDWDINDAVDMTYMFYSIGKYPLAKVTITGWNYSGTLKLINVLPKGTLADGTSRVLCGSETLLHEVEEPDGWVFQYV